MTVVAAAVVGSAVVGAVASNDASRRQANAAKDAARLQNDTATMQLQQQREMYDANVSRMQPFVELGSGAMSQLKSGMAPGGQFTKGFDGSNFQQDPSYQWRLQQGMKALTHSAAAKGSLMTGQGLADITDYAQGAASQEYQNAYNRFNDTQSLLFNRLNTIVGGSQNAAAGLGALGTQVSSNMANTAMSNAQQVGGYMTQAANAQAAGSMGMANSISSGVGTGLNAYYSQQFMNKLNTPTAAPAAPPAAAGVTTP